MAKKEQLDPASMGSRGGKAAARNMTKEQRIERSEKANRAKKKKARERNGL